MSVNLPIEVDDLWVKSPGILEHRKYKIGDLQPSEVLIRVKACAICGSDVHIFKGEHPHAVAPIAVGHEFAGEVVRVGSEVETLKIGDRVCVEPLIVCGRCYFCVRGMYNRCLKVTVNYRAGRSGFTSYFKTTERWAHRIPDNLSFEEASLMEPTSVAVHNAVGAGLKIGDSVAILGAGPIGLILLQIAKSFGASGIYITSTSPHKLDLARRLGADSVINARQMDPVAEVMKVTGGLGVDVVFETAGVEETFNQALKMLKKGGMARIIGTFHQRDVKLQDIMAFVARELHMSGTFGYCWDFPKAIMLTARGQINLKPLISEVVDLNLKDTHAAFSRLANNEPGLIKVIVRT